MRKVVIKILQGSVFGELTIHAPAANLLSVCVPKIMKSD